MNNKFYNINVHSYYSLLKSTLSIDKIINHALSNKQTHVILTDNNLYGAMDFYHKAIKNNLNPVIGLDFTYQNNKYLLIAKSNIGYHNLVRIHSLQNLNKLELNDNLLEDIIAIQTDGSLRINTKEFYATNECATNPVYMQNESEIQTLKILYAISKDLLLSELKINFNNNWFLNDEHASKLYNQNQIDNNKKIIESCKWIINPRTVKLAKYLVPTTQTTKDFLESTCLEGLKKIFTTNEIPQLYIERLTYELNVIDNMGYNDYFLVVADFVNYAKKNNIMIGPGRGSAAGSLVAYALSITEVDPIKYNLIFERFLNPSRQTLPDIDIDVMDTRRQEVIDYIFDKYHPNNTSYIITFQHMKAKMALRDAARVLNVPLPIVDKITKMLPPELEGDLSQCRDYDGLTQLYDEFEYLFTHANQLIGIPRQVSTHAAGIIIADKPLYEYIPIQLGIDDWHLSQYTMEFLEDLGIFKIDILGLKNLSIITEVLELIWKNRAIKIDLHKIDLEDKDVFKEIANAKTIGIFQLESPGMRNTLRKIKPRSIEDISITSALFRPGPQAFINDYVKTREKILEVKYIHPSLEVILSSTLGFCIYQEQVIELAKVVAGFSMAEADVFRRAISKKNENLFAKMKNSFIDGAIKNNFKLSDANQIFDFINAFANYGFNHSHSLAYSFISYQMAYLKYYYPLEFTLTLLKFGDSSNIKNNLYISEAKQRNIMIYNVSIKNSNINFNTYNGGIIFGFINIKGLGLEIAKRIYAAQQACKFKTWQDTIASLAKIDSVNAKVIELLIKVGGFDEFNVDRNFLLLNLNEVLNKANILDPITKQPIFELDISNKYEPMTEAEKSRWEYQLLSYTFSNNKWQTFYDQYQEQYNLSELDLNNISSEKNYIVKLSQIKTTMTKYGKPMAFLEFNCNGVDFSCASFAGPIFADLKPNKYLICKFKLGHEQKIQLHSVIAELED